MKQCSMTAAIVVSIILSWGAPPGWAQTFTSGSTGADGPFSPTGSVTVNLPPNGVFNFTTVNIPSGVTARFARNVANTPVTLLASGNVTIAGNIDIGGSPGGGNSSQTLMGNNRGGGGPGGFDGGNGANGIVSTIGGAGLGSGGGAGGEPIGSVIQAGGGGAGHVAPGVGGGTGAVGGSAYGTQTLLPLIGGSGGGGGGARFRGAPEGGGGTGGGGGGGGGAILIASSQTLTLTGSILARGGNATANIGGSPAPPGGGGGGSGGAVRLVATTLTGTGGIAVNAGLGANGGGTGADGRIRIEAFNADGAFLNFNGVQPSNAQPSSVTLPNNPSLRIASVAGIAAPSAPTSSYSNPDIVLAAGAVNPVTVSFETSNIPLGTALTVKVAGRTGSFTTVTSTPLTGTLQNSTASASVAIPTDQPSIISASASFTLVALGAQGPVFVEGEEVDRVKVTASVGGPAQVAYITKSGREILVPSLR